MKTKQAKPEAATGEQHNAAHETTKLVANESDGFVDTAGLQRVVPLCRRSIYNARERGEIPFVRVGGKILFHVPSVREALIRKQRGTA